MWDAEQIREGLALIESALREGSAGPYALQAAVAGVHASASRPEETDWKQIAALYSLLLRVQPSPVVELNRAVAIAMADGASAGLRLLDELELRGELSEYYLLPAARGDLLRRMGRWVESIAAYRRALALVTQSAEEKFLARRVSEVESQISQARRN